MKKPIPTFAFRLTVLAAGAQAAEIPAPGLAGYWEFDETANDQARVILS